LSVGIFRLASLAKREVLLKSTSKKENVFLSIKYSCS